MVSVAERPCLCVLEGRGGRGGASSSLPSSLPYGASIVNSGGSAPLAFPASSSPRHHVRRAHHEADGFDFVDSGGGGGGAGGVDGEEGYDGGAAKQKAQRWRSWCWRVAPSRHRRNTTPLLSAAAALLFLVAIVYVWRGGITGRVGDGKGAADDDNNAYHYDDDYYYYYTQAVKQRGHLPVPLRDSAAAVLSSSSSRRKQKKNGNNDDSEVRTRLINPSVVMKRYQHHHGHARP